jgi:hypothetical protein
MQWYNNLLHRINALPFGKTVPRDLAMTLLEEIRLRDKLISEFRLFLLSWDATLPKGASEVHHQRWARERANLLKSAAETLEGTASETD